MVYFRSTNGFRVQVTKHATIRRYGQKLAFCGLVLPLMMTAGCGLVSPFIPASEAQSGPGRGGAGRSDDGPVAVKTATAQAGSLAGTLTYTGTTRPTQQVALRSQVSGKIIDLTADVGDSVSRGAVLAQLDGDLQAIGVNQAQAELSARRAETAQAEVSIADAQAAVAQAQATLSQAQIDAQRLRQLANQGALSQQQAEAAELAAANAQQTVRSAQSQVSARQQAAASAADRIDVQRSAVAQSRKQLDYADLRSPLAGVVLSRPVDVGDFVESGATVLELGDLSTLEVTVQVSELDIRRLSIGQSAQVQLDAFPNEGKIFGQIERITPVANETSRLLPVSVTIPNLSGKIGSGLLARVQFAAGKQNRVVVPASALEVGKGGEDTVFVVEGEGQQAKAVARAVRVGDRNQDRVEILSGLNPNESFIVQSDRPLTSGQAVRLSILSEEI